MSFTFDPVAAARQLAQAWRNGDSLDNPAPELSANSETQAYAIQAALREELGEGSAGWKIGGATAAALRNGPTGRASFGFLRPSCVHEQQATRVKAGGPVVLEVEIAMRLARDVRPAQEAFDPATMICEVYLAVEVVRSRYRAGKQAGSFNFLADDAGFHALVLGDALPGATASALLHAPAALHADGVKVADPAVGDDRTDPIAAMRLFWSAAREGDWLVPAGSVVTTGTLIPPLEWARSTALVATLDTLKVEFALEIA